VRLYYILNKDKHFKENKQIISLIKI